MYILIRLTVWVFLLTIFAINTHKIYKQLGLKQYRLIRFNLMWLVGVGAIYGLMFGVWLGIIITGGSK